MRYLPTVISLYPAMHEGPPGVKMVNWHTLVTQFDISRTASFARLRRIRHILH